MNFEEFKNKYQKAPVVEYPNQRIINTALVTVRVLAYNHIDFVSKCLDSILMQKTSFDYEVLIAEDDSNDGTNGKGSSSHM
uniref:glycosyltransferase n=1 Tax=Roseivirga sp. TaxID=1964215 RepID=UPI0040488E53